MATEDEIDWLKGMAQLEDEAGGFPTVTGRAPQVWKNVRRPGYLGKRRDLMHAQFDVEHGAGNWRLAWVVPGFPAGAPDLAYTFEQACKLFYEESYFQHLKKHTADVDFACEFAECIDNSPTNVHSRFDYMAQEASSTHIQDIAMRNVIAKLGRAFTGKRTELLIIRSADSNGYRFGPGNVPLYRPEIIMQPSLCPQWANHGTVEDFWQSNKWLQVRAK
jgi:hypothetical protein